MLLHAAHLHLHLALLGAGGMHNALLLCPRYLASVAEGHHVSTEHLVQGATKAIVVSRGDTKGIPLPVAVGTLPLHPGHGDGYVFGANDPGAYLRQYGLGKYGGWTSRENFLGIRAKARKDNWTPQSNDDLG